MVLNVASKPPDGPRLTWTAQSKDTQALLQFVSLAATECLQSQARRKRLPARTPPHTSLTSGRALLPLPRRGPAPAPTRPEIAAAAVKAGLGLAKPVLRGLPAAAAFRTRHMARAAAPPPLSPRAGEPAAAEGHRDGSANSWTATAGLNLLKGVTSAVASLWGAGSSTAEGSGTTPAQQGRQPEAAGARAGDAVTTAPHSLWPSQPLPAQAPQWDHPSQRPAASPSSASSSRSALPSRQASRQRSGWRVPGLHAPWQRATPRRAATRASGLLSDGGWDATTTTEDWVDTELMCLRSLADSLPSLPAAALSAASGRAAQGGGDAATPIGLWPVELAPVEQPEAAAAAVPAAQAATSEQPEAGPTEDSPALPSLQADVVLDDSSDCDSEDGGTSAAKGSRAGGGGGPSAAALPAGLRGASGALLLRASDLGRLRPGEWLNDNAVEMAIRLTERLQLGPRARALAHVMSTVFFSRLSSRSDVALAALAADYDRVRRWTKRADVFSKTLLLVPVHSRGHWSLIAVINPAAAARRFRAMASVVDPVRAGLADAEATMVQRGADPEAVAELVRARAAQLGVDTSDPMHFAPLLGRLPSVRVTPQHAPRARVSVRRRQKGSGSGSARSASSASAEASAAAESTIDLDGSDDGSGAAPTATSAAGAARECEPAVGTPPQGRRASVSSGASAESAAALASPLLGGSRKSGRSSSGSGRGSAPCVSPLSLVGMEELEAAAAGCLGWREDDATAAECCIVHCDSLRAHDTAKCAAAVRHWLVREWERRRGSGYSLLRGRGVSSNRAISTEHEAEAGALVALQRGRTCNGRPLVPHIGLRVPTQDNSCDCGVFAAAFGRAMLAVLGSWADAPKPTPVASPPDCDAAGSGAAAGSASLPKAEASPGGQASLGGSQAPSPPLLPPEFSTPASLFSLRARRHRQAWPLEGRLALDQLEVRRRRLDLALHMLTAVGGSSEARLALSIPWAGPPAPRWEGRASDAGLMRAACEALPPAEPAAPERSGVQQARTTHSDVLDLASEEEEEEEEEDSQFSGGSQAKRARH